MLLQIKRIEHNKINHSGNDLYNKQQEQIISANYILLLKVHLLNKFAKPLVFAQNKQLLKFK